MVLSFTSGNFQPMQQKSGRELDASQTDGTSIHNICVCNCFVIMSIEMFELFKMLCDSKECVARCAVHVIQRLICRRTLLFRHWFWFWLSVRVALHGIRLSRCMLYYTLASNKYRRCAPNLHSLSWAFALCSMHSHSHWCIFIREN